MVVPPCSCRFPPIKPPCLNLGSGVDATIANCAVAKTPATIAPANPPLLNPLKTAKGIFNDASKIACFFCLSASFRLILLNSS